MILAPVSRVTSLSGLGIRDLEGDIGGKLAGEAPFFAHDEHHFHVLALLHKVGVVNHVLGEGDLLVGFLMHEVEAFLVGIEELIGTPFHFDGLDLGACGEGVFKDAAILEVAEFALHESGTLAGFYVLEPDDGAGLPVEIHAKTVFEISCCCHNNDMFFMF